ncbi:hypothetical protein NADFUDRAFT_81712 [Nadsonia fulvescens var. elongata DSM 6958]|uniref:Tetratricopeptide SHNi-TPR domain-containing protein n=1 Tax=Nadsonia fulvescens var. elongata DSM 6958 TaxID=857566 RepID=A0A1E3PQK1_9ASCO|nr:hypothetical protein NADFUDRAFT_81712 [Nadsonia fulvescens var. elongata DSM 6958]
MDSSKYGDKDIDAMVASGSKAYGLKQYEEAADYFGQACELYAAENEQQDEPTLLFLYGRAIFETGVQKSEVLGGNGGRADGDEKAERNTAKAELAEPTAQSTINKSSTEKTNQGELFQFQNDFEDVSSGNESESDAKVGTGDNDANEDEFETAWQILDLSRSLFEKNLEAYVDVKGKNSVSRVNSSQPEYEDMKKLAECYDILGEVSLESENFAQAAADLQSALDLKNRLYDFSSTFISEAHYKLSLALEFHVMDPTSKKQSIEEMQLAINSVKERIRITQQDDSELVRDLETRLQDLKSSDEDLIKEKNRVLQGILGQTAEPPVAPSLSQSSGSPVVNDLTSMVRKKPDSAKESKRKANSEEIGSSKKPRI